MSYSQEKLQEVFPLKAPFDTVIPCPGDKSISHRALFLGALASTPSLIQILNEGEDVLRTARCLEELGTHLEWLNATTIKITPFPFKKPSTPLYFGNSGTTARLMMGMLAPHPFSVSMTGDPSLSRRPMGRIIHPLETLGATFSSSTLPLIMTGSPQNKDSLSYSLPIASAQVKTGLLFAALQREGEHQIHESIPSRDHTERLFKALHIPLHSQAIGEGLSHTLQGPCAFPGFEITIPQDPSAALYWAVAALVRPPSKASFQNLCWNPFRNKGFLILENMGGTLQIDSPREHMGEPVVNLKVFGSLQHPVVVPPQDVPSLIDDIPILAVAAAFVKGVSRFEGLEELSYKESDRLMTTQRLLTSAGVKADIEGETLLVYGEGKPKGGCTIDPELDHRIALCGAILGLGSQQPIKILNPSVIRSSYPHFFETLTQLSSSKK